jgi:Protein of unknown function (DUF2510)
MTTQLPPAGWYPDPAGGGRLRYFNGSTWTDHYSQPPRQMAAGRFGAPAGVAPQPAMPGEPRIGRRAGSGRQPWMWLPIGVALFGLVGMPLLLFGTGAYDSYAYGVGTPTTATNVHCIKYSRGSLSCTGTWRVGGKSYTGPIMGAYGNESSLDVHVHGGTAYTARAGRHDFIAGTLIVATLTVFFALARWLGRRRTGR